MTLHDHVPTVDELAAIAAGNDSQGAFVVVPVSTLALLRAEIRREHLEQIVEHLGAMSHKQDRTLGRLAYAAIAEYLQLAAAEATDLGERFPPDA
jgi:hypothetical protein